MASALSASALNIDSANKIHLRASATVAWISNVNARADGVSDFSTMAGLDIDYARRAGTISVDAGAGMSRTLFQHLKEANSLDPRFNLRFSKERGRMTGGIQIRAFRQAKADTTVNLRTASWNFPVDLNLHYRVNARYSFDSITSYSRRNYLGVDSLADYTDLGESLTMAYALSSKLSLTAIYHTRFSRTSYDTRAQDHAASLGLRGRIGPKVQGEIRAGYQTRLTTPGGRSYSGMNAMADLRWKAWRGITVVGRLTRDFSTTARAANADTLTASLSAGMETGQRLSLGLGINAGHNRFLDEPAAGTGRRDRVLGADAHATLKLNRRLDLGLTVSRNQTTSTMPGFTQVHEGVALSVSTKW